MVVPGGHMWVVMGGRDGQFCTLRAEQQIGPDFRTLGALGAALGALGAPPWQGPKLIISTLWEALGGSQPASQPAQYRNWQTRQLPHAAEFNIPTIRIKKSPVLARYCAADVTIRPTTLTFVRNSTTVIFSKYYIEQILRGEKALHITPNPQQCMKMSIQELRLLDR